MDLNNSKLMDYSNSKMILKNWSQNTLNYTPKSTIDSVITLVDFTSLDSVSLKKNCTLYLFKLNSQTKDYLGIIYNRDLKNYSTYGVLKITSEDSKNFHSEISTYIQKNKINSGFQFSRFTLENNFIEKIEGVQNNFVRITKIVNYDYRNIRKQNSNLKSNDCTAYYFIIIVNGIIVYSEYLYTECSNALLDLPDLNLGSNNSGNGSNSSSDIEEKIIIDSTIVNNKKINCVFEAMSKSILKDILSGFDANSKYNLIIFMDPQIPSNKEGRVKPIAGTTTFQMGLNETIVNQYSMIWNASIILHESLHAKLYLKAKELFGTTDLTKWPIPIEDMDLCQLTDYFVQCSKESKIWESLTHEWMAQNIDDISSKLRDFVKQFYPNVYNENLAYDLDPYKYLMLKGLVGTSFLNSDLNYYNQLQNTYVRNLMIDDCPTQ